MANLKNLCVLLCLLGSSISFLVPVDASAQGLKGAQMPKKILGRLTYIKGNNDQERWKTFLDAQPQLIGMPCKEVQKRLGEEPISERDLSSVEYGLTQEPVKTSSKDKSWLNLTIFFRNGIAWKYALEAVQ
jgi:hypothetical protein